MTTPSTPIPLPTITPTNLRDLTISTGAVRRLLADLTGYRTELTSQEDKLDSIIKTQGGDQSEVKKLREFVQETDSTIREITMKLNESIAKLEGALDKHVTGWRVEENQRGWRTGGGESKEVEGVVKAMDIIQKARDVTGGGGNKEEKGKDTDNEAKTSPSVHVKYTIIGNADTTVSNEIKTLLTTSMGYTHSGSASMSTIVILLNTGDLSGLGDFLSLVSRSSVSSANMLYMAWKDPFEGIWNSIVEGMKLGAKSGGRVKLVGSVKEVEECVKKMREG